jgi:AhpC/TSA family protein
VAVAPDGGFKEDRPMIIQRSWRTPRVSVAGLLTVLTVLFGGPPRVGAIEVGQPAPDFKLASTFGTDIALGDYRGQKWVLLEFYGADFAPT